MIVPLYVNACTCLCLSHPSLFQSVYIHVSYRNTHTHTHTEHATHLKALYWGKSGYLFPVHLYTHVQICAHLYISGQPQQVVNQSLHTYRAVPWLLGCVTAGPPQLLPSRNSGMVNLLSLEKWLYSLLSVYTTCVIDLNSASIVLPLFCSTFSSVQISIE